MKNKEVFVIVPTLNPNIKIMDKFIDELKNTFSNIVVINDGCEKKYDKYFETLEKEKIIVLKHVVNLGKGRAIKGATNYIFNKYDDCKVIVTADCDGQHTVKDILNCGQVALKNPDSLVIGVRDFKKSIVPWKSRCGNVITRNIFKIFIGLNISDTQTGLRAMSKKIALKFMNVGGERYEFETNTLIDCKIDDIKIIEEKIDTIYLDNNKESHFNPVKDSIMIYKLFAKYLFSAGSSFILDILLFTLFFKLLKNNDINNYILLGTILARIISSLYNYLINKKLVFKKFSSSSLIKYFVLVVIQMFVSGLLVNYVSLLMSFITPVIIKIVIDVFIFIINFIIEREWVFKNK